MTDAIQLFSQVQEEVNKLDVIDGEHINRLAKSGSRLLAIQLEEKDLRGAFDTLDKFSAYDKYFQLKLRRDQANISDVNNFSVSHIYGRIDTGDFIAKHMVPKGLKEEYHASYMEKNHDIFLSQKILKEKYNVDPNTIYTWIVLSGKPRSEIDEFIKPYLNGYSSQEKILYFRNLYNAFKETQERITEPPTYAPASLSGVARETYIKAKELNVLIQSWVQEISKGHETKGNIVLVVDQLRPLPPAIVKAVKQVGELY